MIIDCEGEVIWESVDCTVEVGVEGGVYFSEGRAITVECVDTAESYVDADRLTVLKYVHGKVRKKPKDGSVLVIEKVRAEQEAKGVNVDLVIAFVQYVSSLPKAGKFYRSVSNQIMQRASKKSELPLVSSRQQMVMARTIGELDVR